MKLLLFLSSIAFCLAQNELTYDLDEIEGSPILSLLSVRPPSIRADDNGGEEAEPPTPYPEPEQPEEAIDAESPPPPPSRPLPPPRAKKGDRCQEWGQWERVKCWWPSDDLNTLPASCSAIPTPSSIPEFMKKLVTAKSLEKYSVIMNEYKSRGEPPRCGFCSRSFECRIRNETVGLPCSMKEIRPVEEQCNDEKACIISQEKGGCPAPMFLGGSIDRLKMMIKQDRPQMFAAELVGLNNRAKRMEGPPQQPQFFGMGLPGPRPPRFNHEGGMFGRFSWRNRMNFHKKMMKMTMDRRGAQNILGEMLHGTTCASLGDSCICCCGHYVPNIDTGACEDVRQILPGIEKMFKRIMDAKPSTRMNKPVKYKKVKENVRKMMRNENRNY